MAVYFSHPSKHTLSCLALGIMAACYTSSSFAEDNLTAGDEPTATFQTLVFYSDVYDNEAQQATVSHNSSTKVRQADLINHYLPTVAGVSVGGTSAINQNIYIRGLGADGAGSQLKITVDGVRQPESRGFHHAGISGLDPDLYKATEVAVGNNSVTLGNNAIGGGVAFTTVDAKDLLRPDQSVGASVKLGYDSNDNQLRGTFTAYGKPNDSTDLLLSYGERQSDGGEDGRGDHMQGKDITIKNILAKASFAPLDGHKLTASYQKYDNEGKYPFRPNLGYQRNLPYNIQDGYSHTESYSLGYDFAPHDSIDVTTKIYHLENDSQSKGQRSADPKTLMTIQNSGKTDGAYANVRQKITQHRPNGAWQHLLSYGLEGYKKSATLQSSGITEDATSLGVYLQDRIDFGRVVLTPGIRFDNYQPSKRLSQDDFNQVSGALAGEFNATDNTTLFASYTQLFNGPPLPEGIHQNGQVFINKDIKAETGANAEVGFTTHFDNIATNNDRLNLTAKYFNTDYKNKINYLSGIDCESGLAVQGGACSSYSNAGKTTVNGYEINSNYRLASLLLTAGYAHAESETDKGYQLGTDSGDQLNVGFKYDVNEQVSLGSNIRHVASLERRTNAATVTQLPSFTTYDVFGSYRPRQLPRLSLDAGVYNLSDVAYAEHTSLASDLAMGRNVKVGLSYQF